MPNFESHDIFRKLLDTHIKTFSFIEFHQANAFEINTKQIQDDNNKLINQMNIEVNENELISTPVTIKLVISKTDS